MKKYLMAALAISLFQLSHAQEAATGMVYEDTNGNGKKDRKEKGIPDVAVSNGIQVVQTDKKGEYSLPLGNDNILFVIKPAGYALPVDEHQQPRFYRIHKPNGSPVSKYAGVAATGELPKRVDFPLLKKTEEKTFTALVFGDSQPYTKQEVDFFKKGIIEEVKQTKGQSIFGITLGDLVGNDLSLHPDYKDAIAQIGLPWFHVIGNHDMNFDATTDSLSDETFETNFGPNNYAFNYGDVHFIVLDDILYPNPRTNTSYLGGFRKSQLDFVENDLKFVPKDKLIVLAYHIPLFVNENAFEYKDRNRLFELLKGYRYTLGLSAHTHYQMQYHYGKEEGWNGETPFHEYNVGTTNGDWYSGALNELGVPISTMRDGTPRGYAYLHIDGNRYSFNYRAAGRDTSYQIEITAPDQVYVDQSNRISFYANFFVGKEDDVVEYRVDGGEWKALNYAQEADPQYQDNIYRWDLAKTPVLGRRPSDPVPSTHLWKAKLPRWNAPGNHTLEVRATDMFGNTFTQSKEIEVLAP